MSRYDLPYPKCHHKRTGIVTSGELTPDYKGPLASHAVCDRPACIEDAKQWAYASTHIEPTHRLDKDRNDSRNDSLPLG